MELKSKHKEEILIKKILVKCPPGKEKAFSLFPFLVTLSEEYPKAEINLICEEGCAAAYNFLPFKMRFFERPKEKVTFFQTHQFCANLNDVFNIDLFFDLENTFNSAFMGYNFRSMERVGFETGMNKYFLSKKYPPVPGATLESSSLKLLELYSEKNLQDVRVSKSRDEGALIEPIEQLFKEPEPPKFIMVMLDDFQSVTKEIGMWTKFFDCFTNQKFIIWSMQDEDLISELFASIDLGHNSLYMHKGDNPKELIYLFNKVKGVVTNNLWSEGLCTYYGVDSLSFFKQTLTGLPLYDFFRMKPQRFYFSETGEINYKYLDEEKSFAEMNLVVDHLHFFFKL